MAAVCGRLLLLSVVKLQLYIDLLVWVWVQVGVQTVFIECYRLNVMPSVLVCRVKLLKFVVLSCVRVLVVRVLGALFVMRLVVVSVV